MMISNKCSSAVLLAIVLLISGCASGPSVQKVNIRASHEIKPADKITRANVGIYYEPSLANYVHVQSISDSIATVNAGQESVALFNAAIPQVFEQTELIDQMPPYDIPQSQLDGIIEPRLDYVNWRMFFDTEEDFFHVAYTFLFYTSQGVPISKWTIIGKGPKLKDQLADAAQKFVDEFATAPETRRFREYLETKRVDEVGFDVNDIQIEASLAGENELGLQLKEAGILPVRIKVTNQTGGDITGRGFDVRLILADGTRLVPAFPLAVVSSFEFQAAVTASDPALVGSFFGLPGLFGSMFGSHSERVDTRKQQGAYFEKSRLKEITLSDGESVEGILYFILPPEVARLEEATLSFWFIDEPAANGERAMISLRGIDYEISPATKAAYEKTTNIYGPAMISKPVSFTGDFSGTYVAYIPGDHPDLYIDGPNPIVILKQDGDDITGTFGNYGGKIYGKVVGDRVEFGWFARHTEMGTGIWYFTRGSSKVVGTFGWKSPTGYTWNLTKFK